MDGRVSVVCGLWARKKKRQWGARVGQARYFLVDNPSKASRSGSQRKLVLELDGGGAWVERAGGRLGVFDEGRMAGWMGPSAGDALGEGSEPTGELCPQSMSWQLSYLSSSNLQAAVFRPHQLDLNTQYTLPVCPPCHAMPWNRLQIMSSAHFVCFRTASPVVRIGPRRRCRPLEPVSLGSSSFARTYSTYICSTGLINMTLHRNGSSFDCTALHLAVTMHTPVGVRVPELSKYLIVRLILLH